MEVTKRQFTQAVFGVSVSALFGGGQTLITDQRQKTMYGLIGKMTAVDGKRDALAAILLDGLKGMPGNLSYVVAEDPTDANALWITEVWQDKASHEASLSLQSVQEAIAKGRPLIAGMERVAETSPLGGHGI